MFAGLALDDRRDATRRRRRRHGAGVRNDGAVAMQADYESAASDDRHRAPTSTSRATARDRFAKALASGADAVILDLEDAVPVDRQGRRPRATSATFLDRVPAPDRSRRGCGSTTATGAATTCRRWPASPPSPASSCRRPAPDVLAARHADAPDVAADPARRERRRHRRRSSPSPRPPECGRSPSARSTSPPTSGSATTSRTPRCGRCGCRSSSPAPRPGGPHRSAPSSATSRTSTGFTAVDRARASPRRVRRRPGDPPQAGRRRNRRAHADGRTRSPPPSGSSTPPHGPTAASSSTTPGA